MLWPWLGLGTYASLSACQNNCVIPATYDCDLVSGCYDLAQDWELSLSACQVIVLLAQQMNLVYYFKKINEDSRCIWKRGKCYKRKSNFIYIYDDGTVEK